MMGTIKLRLYKYVSGLRECAVLFLALAILPQIVEAKDLLAGTETELLDTLQGTGKKYIYLAEGILSMAAYIKTKNLLVLFGIIIVALFFNVVMKFANGSGF